MKAFQDAFKTKYGHEPNTFSALGYDLGKFLCDAIVRAGEATPEAIIKAVAETENFKGVTGSFSMGEDHTPVKECFIIELNNGVAAKANRIDAHYTK